MNAAGCKLRQLAFPLRWCHTLWALVLFTAATPSNTWPSGSSARTFA